MGTSTSQPFVNLDADFTINTAKNLTSNYNLGPLNISGADAYDFTVDGDWLGTYGGSVLSGSGTYAISGSATGSNNFVISASGDHSGSFSGSVSHGTGSYCIFGTGSFMLLTGSNTFTGSYKSGSLFEISGTSGYYLTGTITSYSFCGEGTYYVSGSSAHTLSGSGTGTGALATASYYISDAKSYDIAGASVYTVTGTSAAASFSGTGSMTLEGTGDHQFVGYESTRDAGQAPFSLGVKGPATLRGRTTAYKVEK
tara:strand:+ start:207 stop:971 length:765 start_codon:yes stop_codon:yes gene_type:complete